MTYLALALAGALGTALAVWRMQVWKGRARVTAKELAAAEILRKWDSDKIAELLRALESDRDAHAKIRADLENVIADLKARRKEALDALDRCHSPGALRSMLRESLGVSEVPKP